MLKTRLIKRICQQWITAALGPKLIGRRGEGTKHLVAQYIPPKELLLRCGQLTLFRDNCRLLHHFIDSLLLLMMAAKERSRCRTGRQRVPCVKSWKSLWMWVEQYALLEVNLVNSCVDWNTISLCQRKKKKKKYRILLKCLKSHFAKVLIYHPVISILSTISIMIYFVFTLGFSSSKHKADTSGN